MNAVGGLFDRHPDRQNGELSSLSFFQMLQQNATNLRHSL
jgi:hypothetical protein